jgi:hypothetical protein
VLYQAVRLLCLSVIVSGCALNSTYVPKTAQIEKLGADNKGIVILHTSLHDGACESVQARLAQPDASGRYVAGGLINLKSIYDLKKLLPSQITLPAGDYGFVDLKCNRAYANRFYTARVAQIGNILDGSGAIYEQPIATFTVRPGEIVDIGSLQLPSRPSAALWGPNLFNAVVVPIPEPWMQTMATNNPTLYSMRVTRLMKTPTKSQPRSEPTAEAAAR